MPFTLIFPLSRYATARGKQCVCAKEPMICDAHGTARVGVHVRLSVPSDVAVCARRNEVRTLISSTKILKGGQWIRASLLYTP